MSGDDIRVISQIVGGDKTYRHFVRRINKEFKAADEERNSKVFVLYQKDTKDENVGFAVIGHSPSKMKVWESTFKDEGWVSPVFKMRKPAYELMYMYIRLEVRKKGYARRLFRRVVSFTKGNHMEAIYAYVGEESSMALKFYKKRGGKIIKDLSDETTSNAFLEWRL